MKQLLIILLTLVITPTMMAQHEINIAILGDSNTWIGGDNCDNPKGWNKWFKEAFKPATIKSYARSGATWTNTPQTHRKTHENIDVMGDNNVIYNQICRLEEAVDGGEQPKPQLVLIMAGTNDAWFQKERPEVFSATAEEAFAIDNIRQRRASQNLTLAESVRYGCETLKAVCPWARIILITPIQSSVIKKAYINKVGNIIEDCGKLMGISVIRMDQRIFGMTDGIHTSERGAKEMGTILAKQIATLVNNQ